MLADLNFSNSHFYWKAWILSLAKYIISSVRLTSFVFKKISAINCQLFFHLKLVFHGEKKLLVHLVTQMITEVLFLETTFVLMCVTEVLYLSFPFNPTEYKKTHTQGLRFNKGDNFYCFPKVFLNETGLVFLFPCKCEMVKHPLTASTGLP